MPYPRFASDITMPQFVAIGASGGNGLTGRETIAAAGRKLPLPQPALP